MDKTAEAGKGDFDDFEMVDISNEFTKITVAEKVNLDNLYSIGSMHPELSLEKSYNHPKSRKLESQVIQVICDGEPEMKDTYYYSFIIRRDRKNDIKIKKRFNNFKDFRQQLKDAFFCGEDKTKVGDGEDSILAEGYHIIPTLDESMTPSKLDQAKERMEHLRLFLLKILCNSALSNCKTTEVFLTAEATKAEGMVSNLKGKAGRFLSFVTGKISEESEHVRSYLKGSTNTTISDPELARLKTTAHTVQQHLSMYKEMLGLITLEFTPEQAEDLRHCIGFARDIELQVDSILDAEKMVKLKENMLESCKVRKEKSSEKLLQEVDAELIKNIGIWLDNTKIFLKLEKEAILKSLELDLKVLEKWVVILMAAVTEVKSQKETKETQPAEQSNYK